MALVRKFMITCDILIPSVIISKPSPTLVVNRIGTLGFALCFTVSIDIRQMLFTICGQYFIL